MKRTLVLAALITSTVAHAQPGVTEAPGAAGELSDPGLEGGQRTPQAELPHEQRLVEKLTSSARMAARDGQCRAIAVIRQRVRELDATYHRDVFVADPMIASCVEGVSRRPPELEVVRDASDVARPAPASALSMAATPSAPYASPGVALALSLGTTLAGVALFAVADANPQAAPFSLAGMLAVTLGPTTGHIYAGRTWNPGLKLRLGGLGAAVAGAALALAACPPFSGSCDSEGAAVLGGLTFIGGGITYGVGTIYEIATAADSARAANRARTRQLAVGPVLGQAPGLAVAGTF